MILKRLLRGHSPFFSRFMFVIVILLCLPFIQCSKGNGVISPDSFSGGGVNIDDGGFGSILQDSERKSQYDNSGFPTQMTPILSKDSFDEIDKGVALALGESDFPEDEVMHLFTEPEGRALSNPPVLRFAFAAKPDVIKPEEISVSVDGIDISSLIHYNYFYNQARKTNYYVAHYTPDELISPERNFQMEINYTPQKGRAIAKSCTFDVPENNDSSVILAGFTADKIPTDKAPAKTNYRELLVQIRNPVGVKEKSRLINIEKWKLEYLDKSPFPAISNIKKIREGAYMISLAENAIPGKECSISFEILKGRSTPKFEFRVPREPVERGGGVARSGMAACCEGEFETVIPHSAENCDMYHTIDFSMDCPIPTCYSFIDEFSSLMEYSFLNNYDDPDVDYEIGFVPNVYVLHQGWSCVSSYQQPYDARSDFSCNFWLKGFDGQGRFCGTLDSTGAYILESDNIPPRV